MRKRRKPPRVIVEIPLEGRVEVFVSTDRDDVWELLTFDLLQDRRRYEIVAAALTAQLPRTSEERIEHEERVEHTGHEHTMEVDEP